MSIAHELSSDVAAAVLATEEGESPVDACARAKVVLEVHSTLRRLSAEYREKARAAKACKDDGQDGGDAVASA
jgi:hypothetical protein